MWALLREGPIGARLLGMWRWCLSCSRHRGWVLRLHAGLGQGRGQGQGAAWPCSCPQLKGSLPARVEQASWRAGGFLELKGGGSRHPRQRALRGPFAGGPAGLHPDQQPRRLPDPRPGQARL